MSVNDVVQVSIRQSRGTRSARRMRAEGKTPAVLYGHGEETVSLSLPTSQIEAVLRHGGKVVQLSGEVSDSALVSEVQWDGLGNEILHLDLTRVSAGETVETTVPLELRGEAPGTRAGGVLKHLVHEVPISCSVSSIPERLVVSVGGLELGDSITVADLELPAGATTPLDDSSFVVQCVEVAAETDEEESAVAEGVEPEVIGRKAEDEESEG